MNKIINQEFNKSMHLKVLFKIFFNESVAITDIRNVKKKLKSFALFLIFKQELAFTFG